MPNHFHFIIQIRDEATIQQFYAAKFPTAITPSKDYSKIVMQQFSNMHNGYAQAYNKMFGRRGALFIDYLRRKQVTDDAYFIRLVHYIHNNPVHHHFCSSIDDWTYSSYQTILSEKSTNIERETVLEWYGGTVAYKDFHLHTIELQNEIEC